MIWYHILKSEIIWSYISESSCQIQPEYGPYFRRIPLFRLSHRRTRPLAVTHISCDLTAMEDSTDAYQIGPPWIQYQPSANACVPFFAEDPQIETLQIHQKFIPTIAFQNWLEQRSSSFLKDHDRITTSLLDFNNLIVHICCRACSMDAARQKKPSVCAALRVDGTA